MNSTVEEEVKLVYAAVFGCIVTLGLPLNAASLWILLRHHGLRSSTSIFMVNLALSDLLLVISLPMRAYFYATGTWPLNRGACIWITMLFRNNIRSSIFFITFINVDRLLAVVYPLRSRHLRTTSNTWRAVALVWLFVLVVNIPESVELSTFYQNQSKANCFNLYHPLHYVSAAVSYQATLAVTMLAANVVCTAMVSWTLCKHLSDSASVNNKVNVMLIFVMSLVMFTICFLPISVGLLIDPAEVTPLVCLASVNCCLDPLVYYFSLDAFWKKKQDTDPSPQEMHPISHVCPFNVKGFRKENNDE